jgi:bacterial/archaeal transporter family-2 protein
LIVPLLLALLAGAMLPLQAAFNARLGRLLGSSIWAASVSAAVTTLSLVVIGAVMLRTPPRIAEASNLPWWAWAGGFCGVLALVGMTTAAPRLGAATMIAAVMCSQVALSLLLDRFGLFDLPAQPLTAQRMLAAGLLAGGAFLIR